jgi:hypothetical protein
MNGRRYAVVWSDGDGVVCGSLEPRADRFELCGRDQRLTIPFSGLDGASIARRHADRLRGLPVLALRSRDATVFRIASLEGAGALHELAHHVERAGLAVAV